MHDSLAATPSTPPVIIDDPARQNRTIRLQPLPDHLQTQTVKTAKRGQIRRGEGSVRHVEVFPMGSVRTPIM
jgi:hypothetical protein